MEKTIASREADKKKITDKKHELSLTSAASSAIDIGNFLGVSGDPNRVVNDKLEVLHQDLQRLIGVSKNSGPAGVTFPGS